MSNVNNIIEKPGKHSNYAKGKTKSMARIEDIIYRNINMYLCRISLLHMKNVKPKLKMHDREAKLLPKYHSSLWEATGVREDKA